MNGLLGMSLALAAMSMTIAQSDSHHLIGDENDMRLMDDHKPSPKIKHAYRPLDDVRPERKDKSSSLSKMLRNKGRA